MPLGVDETAAQPKPNTPTSGGSDVDKPYLEITDYRPDAQSGSFLNKLFNPGGVPGGGWFKSWMLLAVPAGLILVKKLGILGGKRGGRRSRR